jgi:hypothetical protein
MEILLAVSIVITSMVTGFITFTVLKQNDRRKINGKKRLNILR